MAKLFIKLAEAFKHFTHMTIGHHVHDDEKTTLEYDSKLFCDGMHKDR